MTLLAISVDPPDESRKFARDYGMTFPLLYDEGAKVSRAYVGVNYDDTSIPGVVVIGRDGAIKYRQIAETKDDRLTAAQVLAQLDRTLGTTGAAASTGYAVLGRTQLRADAGGGAHGVHADVAALFPLGRYLTVGPWLATEPADGPQLEVDLAVGLRLPLLADTAAIEVIGTAGSTLWRDTNAGVRAGVWVAWTPTIAFHLDGGTSWLSARDAATTHAWFGTAGVSWLVR